MKSRLREADVTGIMRIIQIMNASGAGVPSTIRAGLKRKIVLEIGHSALFKAGNFIGRDFNIMHV